MPPTGPGGFRALKHNMLINIGDAHIFVSLLPTGGSDLQERSYPTLQLKYIVGARQMQRDSIKFQAKDYMKNEK